MRLDKYAVCHVHYTPFSSTRIENMTSVLISYFRDAGFCVIYYLYILEVTTHISGWCMVNGYLTVRHCWLCLVFGVTTHPPSKKWSTHGNFFLRKCVSKWIILTWYNPNITLSFCRPWLGSLAGCRSAHIFKWSPKTALLVIRLLHVPHTQISEI